MTKLIAKLAVLKTELGWHNLIGLALAVVGGLLFLPGSLIIGYFNMPAAGISIVLCICMVSIGCMLMKDRPTTNAGE